jgi:site-specific DNA-methyltransferase (cytosine-N4-specific)
LPTIPFADAFIDAALNFLIRLQDAQLILGVQAIKGEALLHDTTAGGQTKKNRNFDAAVTSPPYAMALPYIDTQRLSLVWLNLIPATEILRLESNLVGSREVRGTSRRELDEQLAVNYANLPEAELNFCARLASSLGPSDGFRRQAVSGLLYRYFAAMQASFAAVHKQLKRGAPYALVVGHNHTVLGGKRFDINTPAHLAALAKQSGWIVDEMIPLQTYQRYGYHMDNAVAAETLLLLRRP